MHVVSWWPLVYDLAAGLYVASVGACAVWLFDRIRGRDSSGRRR